MEVGCCSLCAVPVAFRRGGVQHCVILRKEELRASALNFKEVTTGFGSCFFFSFFGSWALKTLVWFGFSLSAQLLVTVNCGGGFGS